MIIRNKIILILGRPGEGKTFFASFIASHYSRIFSNVEILERGVPIISLISSIDDIKEIAFSETKGIVLLDE
jgi:SpoVK/Ycf46/Vps4 family AAA+-type ATPase